MMNRFVNIATYTGFASMYDQRYSSKTSLMNFHSLCKQHPLPNNRVLDLCCGTGEFALALSELGYNVTAVDLSEDMIRIAKQKSGADHVQWICGDITATDWGQDFGAIVSNFDSLNYILDPKAMKRIFKRIYDSLTLNGVLLCDLITPYQVQTFNGVFEFDIEGTILYMHSTQSDDDHSIRRLELKTTTPEGNITEELHFQRGYDPRDINRWLIDIWFQQLYMLDIDKKEYSSISDTSTRVLYAFEKC